jgi:hypothetical protein
LLVWTEDRLVEAADPTIHDRRLGSDGRLMPMAEFTSPADLIYNRGPISDPEDFAREAGASTEAVIERAEADGAPFVESDELRAWVAQGLEELS